VKNIFLSIALLFGITNEIRSQVTTVTRFNTLIKPNHNIGLSNPVFDQGSPMTYDAAEVNTKGAAFRCNYTNQGGKDFDGYPSGTIGGFKANNVYSPGNPIVCGMPVQIKNLKDNLRINWKVSQTNANDPGDKWWATINVIFDGGTATSEPIEAERDYDLVIQNVSYEEDDFLDLTKPGGAYWYFARNSDGSIKPFTVYLSGVAHQWAVRYKFFDYPVGHPDEDKNDKVHIKFIQLDNSKPIPYLDHSLKQFIDCTKSYLSHLRLNAKELALAKLRVAPDDLWIKSVSAGYEVYEGAFTIANDYFYTTIDNTPPPAISNLTSTEQNGGIVLNWGASTDSAFDSYNVYRSTNGGNYNIIASSIRSNNYIDKSVANGIHKYYVTAKDRSFNESSQSNLVTITIGSSPIVPSNVLATVTSCTTANLTWKDNSNDESGFNILRSTDGINYSLVQTVAANIVNYSFTNLSPSTAYTFQVNAFNSVGSSSIVVSNNIITTTCQDNGILITTSLDPAIKDKTKLDIGFNRRSDNGNWWSDNSFKGLVSEMNPDVVRYPGGTQANYWDWRTGKFIDNTDKTWGANTEVLKIPQFVKAIPERTKIIYVVNIARPTPSTGVNVNASEAVLKSNATLDLKINDMLAAIAEFGAQGKLPDAIELGNEFYFGNTEAGIFEIQEIGGLFYGGWDAINQRPFQANSKKDATQFIAKFYLEQCNKIVAAIKAKYPNMKFALIATRLEANAQAREVWNNTIFNELNSNPIYATLKKNIDAVTQHHYLSDNYGDQTVINNIPTAKVAIAEGIQYPIERQADYDLVPSLYKIWLTEYGVTKTNADLTWASGLRYAALVHSWISRGSKIGQLDYHYISDANVVKVGSPMKLASIGIAAKMVAKAFADMTEMQEIIFNNNPNNVNNTKALYGYKFKNANKEAVLIINIGETNFQQVPFNNLFRYSGQAVMTQYYSNAPFVSDVFEGSPNIVFSSGNVSNFVGLNNFSITVIEVAKSLPNAPTTVVATPVNCTSANLSWIDNSNDETGFNILRSTDGVNYTLVQSLEANITNYSFTNLSPSTNYTFRVNAFNNFGTSTNAVSNSITTVACPVNFNLSVAATNGTVTPSSGTYPQGTSVTLTATPNAGYQFSGWSGDVVSTINPITVVMNGNKNIVANFTLLPVNYTLSVIATNGTVSPSSGTYPQGTSVTLTATPNAGYQFSGWSRDVVSTINPITVVMNGNKNIVANFTLLPVNYTLSVIATNGTVTPSSGTYPQGTSVTLTATPSAGYQFSGWSGDVVSTINPITVVMNSNKNIVANFTLVPVNYTLSVTAINGTVTPSSGTYPQGTSVTLTATPNAGYQFSGWSGDVVSTTNPITVVMNSNKNIVANFTLLPVNYTLSVTATNGTVSPSSGTYPQGTSVTLTATPNAGYQFSGWSGDVVSTINPITVVMNGNKNIVANFILLPVNYTLSVTAANGTVTPSNGTYLQGTSVTLTATPSAGYQFSGWSGDVVSTTNPINVVMNGNKNIVAKFVIITSTSEVTDSDVKIFPNPVNENINIEVQDADINKGFISIFDCIGRLLTSKKITNTISQISLHGSPGVYYVRVVSHDKIVVRQIVKM
jgi:hypothetical protein